MKKIINKVFYWMYMTINILAGLFGMFMLVMEAYVVITGAEALCLPMVILCVAFVVWGLLALDAVINPEKYN